MTKSGGEISAETTKVYDGGHKKPEVLAGPAQAANIVVTRGYGFYVDNHTMRELRQKVGNWYTTVSVTPADTDLHAYNGAPLVCANALLVNLTEPEVDASSGDAAMIQLEFAISGWQ